MNAPIMSLSGSTVSVADPIWQLGTVGDYTTAALGSLAASARVGASSGLTIEFSGFKYKKNSEQAFAKTTALAPVTSFANIDSDTWTQVAHIMNMFSSGTKSSTANGGSQRDETNTTAKNLAVWSETDNSWIQADLTGGDNNGTVKTGWTSNTSTSQAVTESGGSTSSTSSLAESTTSATKTHNGVKWTYKNGSPTAAGRDSSTNEITIEGKVNIYRSKNGSTSYQTAFKTNALIKLISKNPKRYKP